MEDVGRERIGESLGSRVPFMQFSPLTPSNRGHHVRDILSPLREREAIRRKSGTKVVQKLSTKKSQDFFLSLLIM